MRVSATLSTYLARQFLVGMAIAFVALASLIFLVDLVELGRRASGAATAGVWLVAEMASLHLPYLAQRVVPYAVLIGTMLTLTRLTRTNELAVARAAGVATWQILLPGLGLAVALGVFMMAVFNPLASAMLSRYELLDARNLRGQESKLALSSSGLWLRQADDFGEAVIHAQRISQPGLVLHDVIIFRFQGTDRFVERIDAATARLEHGYWLLSEALITGPGRPSERRADYEFETQLTDSQIQESFGSPETLSFWRIPGFIALLERAGFSALKHRLHWHSVLSLPVLLAGMVLVGATFSSRLPRRGASGLMVGVGVLVGFALYVFSDVVTALGLSASIPVLLAAWAPAAVALLAGAAMLLHARMLEGAP